MHPNFVRPFRATRFKGGVEGKARFGISGGLFLWGSFFLGRGEDGSRVVLSERAPGS
jgi:hypothetical protein